MSKPAWITPVWEVRHDISVKEVENDLGIKWEDVEGYTVKHGRLYVKMKDQEEPLEFDFYPNTDIELDKWPTKVLEYDDKWVKTKEEKY